MFSSFIPETELERAFVQANSWDAAVIWRRSRLCYSREQWAISAGFILSLARHYAANDDFKEQAQTLGSILGLLERLSGTERHALFRACHVVVMRALDEKTIDCTDIVLFLQLLLEVVGASPGSSFASIDMFRRLGLIFERLVVPAELDELRAYCRRRLGSTGLDISMPWEGLIDFDEANKAAISGARKDTPKTFAANPSPARADPVAPVVTTPRTVDEHRLNLQNKLDTAKQNYGLTSTEVCTALVKLIDFHIEQKEKVSVFSLLDELTSLCGEQSVKLNTYQIRAVYAVSNRVSDQVGFLALIEELERAVFLRRARLVGFDVTSAGALMRLAFLWHASGRLDVGRKFCANVLQHASKQLQEDDFTWHYLRSIHDAVEKSSSGGEVLLPVSLFDRYDHSDEFIASQAVVALHHFHGRRKDQSLLFLNELINYYGDCIGEAARRAGEMLWIVAATELGLLGEFVATLIRASSRKATDRYLVRQFDDHLKRMVESHGTIDETIRWLKLAVECRSWSAVAGDSDCVSLMVLLASALEAKGDLHALVEIRERIDKAREEAGPAEPEPRLNPSSKYLIGRHVHRSHLQISEQMKLIKMVEILLSKESLAEAETAWHDAVLHCDSNAVIPDLKAVTKNLIDRLIEKNMFAKAAEIAHNPQIRKLDCGFFKARLASACIKSGDLFTGAAILLQAFAAVD